MSNLKILKQKEADNYFIRKNKLFSSPVNNKIEEFLALCNLKVSSILEIGCANGYKLAKYQKMLKLKSCFGVDLSKKAIKDGKKRYKKINFRNLSSLEIDKIKPKFDMIICGFFLYQLDREDIFLQFDKIFKKLNNSGYLLIEDFDPLFNHSNKSLHNKKLKSYKMSFDNFLVQSGLFKLIFKYKSNLPSHTKYNVPIDKKKFKSNDISVTLFKKINFEESYPENI